MDKFSWDSECEDSELVKTGITVLLLAGRSTAIQKFVEDLSYKIRAKCDWSYCGGRAHVEVPKGYADKARMAISDSEWLNSYKVPYSDETWNNGTYFEVLIIY